MRVQSVDTLLRRWPPPPVQDGGVNDVRPDSRRAWLLLTVLVAGYIGVYLCRKNLSVATPLLRAEFGVSKEQVGRIASIGTLAYAIGKMLLGPVIDRFGGRGCFLAALAGVAVFGAASAFAPSLGVLAVVYAGNRLAGAGAWGSMVKLSPAWFRERNLALAMGVLSLSYVFGGAAAVAFGGQVAAWSGQSWRAVMGVPSLVLFGLLGICAMALPKGYLNREYKHRRAPEGFRWAHLRALTARRAFWIVCALSFTLTLVRETFNDWTVDFIKTQAGPQLSMRVAAFLSTPFDLCGAAGILLLGSVFGRLGPKTRARVLGAMLSALAVVLLLLPRLSTAGIGPVVVAVGAVGFLALGPYSLLAGYFSVQLQGAGLAATVAGIVDSVGYLAGVLAGSAFGWLLDRGGYALGFHALAGCSVAAALFALVLNFAAREEKR